MSQLFDYREIFQRQLPRYVYPDNDTDALVLGSALNRLQVSTDEVELNINPVTALEEGIIAWEKFFKLPINKKLGLKVRRERVLTEFIQYVGDLNVIRHDEMVDILSMFDPGVIVNEHIPERFFEVLMTISESYDHVEIVRLIQEIKPSYLGYGVIASFQHPDPSLYVGAALTQVERVKISTEMLRTDGAVVNDDEFNRLRFNQ